MAVDVSKIPSLELLARTSEIYSEVDFSEEQLSQLLGNLKQAFGNVLPVLDKNEDRYALKNNLVDVAEQLLIKVTKKRVQLVWAQKTNEFTAIEMIKKLSEICLNTVPHIQDLAKYIDTEYFFNFKTKICHYDLIQNVYYSSGPFAQLCKKEKGRKNLSNDIRYRLLLENKKVLLVSITGTHSESDIKKDYTEEESMRIGFSIGQTSGLNSIPLARAFEEHLTFADNLMNEELLSMLVLPLANEIARGR